MSESVIQVVVPDEEVRDLLRQFINASDIQNRVLIHKAIVKTRTRTITDTVTIKIVVEGTREEVIHE